MAQKNGHSTISTAIERLRRRSGEGRRLGPDFGGLAPNVKVLVGMGSLLALLAVAIVAALLLIVDLNDDATRLTDNQVQYATAIDAAALNAKAIANDERGYLLSGNPEFIQELDVRTGNARAAFVVAANAAETDAQHRAVIEANAGFERWVHALRGETATYEAGNRRKAIETSLGPVRTLRKSYEKSLARAQALGDDAIKSARSSVSSTTKRSVAILLAYLVVALAIGIFITAWVARTVFRAGGAMSEIGVDRDSVEIIR